MNILKKTKKKMIISFINAFLSGTHFFSLKRFLLNTNSDIKIGKNTRIVGPIYLPVISCLEIGDNTWIGRNFAVEGNGEVKIGNSCDLGPRVSFVTGSHDEGDQNRRAGEGFNGTITVGDGTWLGAGVTVLPNVIIEKGTIVGAASVVTKNLGSNCIYVGNPAKLLRNL